MADAAGTKEPPSATDSCFCSGLCCCFRGFRGEDAKLREESLTSFNRDEDDASDPEADPKEDAASFKAPKSFRTARRTGIAVFRPAFVPSPALADAAADCPVEVE